MKYIFLILLSFLSAYSYSQVPDGWRLIDSRKVGSKPEPKTKKEEICEWIVSKMLKYKTSPNIGLGNNYNDISYVKGVIKIEILNTNANYSIIQKIFINNITRCIVYDDYINISGFQVLSQRGKVYDTDQVLESQSDGVVFHMDFSAEENLISRMQKAFDDLIDILKKERQEQNEPY